MIYIVFSAACYSLDITWSRWVVELQVSVWVEDVVVLVAPLFTCLNQCRTLLVTIHRDVKQSQQHLHIGECEHGDCVLLQEVRAVQLILLEFVFQDEFPKRGLWIHTFLLVCYCNTGRIEKKERERRVREKLRSAGERRRVSRCDLIQLIYSHDLCVWTENTWVIYDRLFLNELRVDPADETLYTLALARSVGWLSWRGNRHGWVFDLDPWLLPYWSKLQNVIIIRWDLEPLSSVMKC